MEPIIGRVVFLSLFSPLYIISLRPSLVPTVRRPARFTAFLAPTHPFLPQEGSTNALRVKTEESVV